MPRQDLAEHVGHTVALVVYDVWDVHGGLCWYLHVSGVDHICAGDPPCLGWRDCGYDGRAAVEVLELHHVGLSTQMHMHDVADVARPQILDFVARKVGD